MKSQIHYALAHPVFDPFKQILPGHSWRAGRLSFVLTANIGLE